MRLTDKLIVVLLVPSAAPLNVTVDVISSTVSKHIDLYDLLECWYSNVCSEANVGEIEYKNVLITKKNINSCITHVSRKNLLKDIFGVIFPGVNCGLKQAE